MKPLDLSAVDEVYYSADLHDYLLDTADGTRLVHEGTREFARIEALLADWTQEPTPGGVLYHRTTAHKVSRNAGGHLRRAG